MNNPHVRIAFINTSQILKNRFAEYSASHSIEADFVNFTHEDIQDHSTYLSENEWDLILYDSIIDESELNWLVSQKPENPLMPFRRHTQTLCDHDLDIIFEGITFTKFLNSLTDENSGEKSVSLISKKGSMNIELNENSIIGQSEEILNVLRNAKKIADSHANVFISGESGTGKELLAKFIHDRSRQKNGPFIAINCTAIPEQLLESELFGHCKGSFTGATSNKIGLFEAAHGGTLFLDEIGDLNMNLQGKLLRVLQERKIRRVGENKSISIDVRIISATHKNLKHAILENQFREDLYYRLNVIPIHIPPLRERPDDVLALAHHFLNLYSKENGKNSLKFSEDFKNFLLSNPWKGNVRELQNFIECSVVMCDGQVVSLVLPHDEIPNESNRDNDNYENTFHDTNDKIFKIDCSHHLIELKDVLQRYIEFAVTYNAGAKDITARQLGIDRKTLYKRLTKH